MKTVEKVIQKRQTIINMVNYHWSQIHINPEVQDIDTDYSDSDDDYTDN
jgi:hypothetical protein